jgi:transcriptional regulator with XRE-family HTH domain
MEKGRIPNKLKMFRRCHGYSQKKVARILGLADTSTLSRWECGGAIPSTVQVFRLARIYQTLPHELFEELWNQHIPAANLLAQETEQFSSKERVFV